MDAFIIHHRLQGRSSREYLPGRLTKPETAFGEYLSGRFAEPGTALASAAHGGQLLGWRVQLGPAKRRLSRCFLCVHVFWFVFPQRSKTSFPCSASGSPRPSTHATSFNHTLYVGTWQKEPVVLRLSTAHTRVVSQLGQPGRPLSKHAPRTRKSPGLLCGGFGFSDLFVGVLTARGVTSPCHMFRATVGRGSHGNPQHSGALPFLSLCEVRASTFGSPFSWFAFCIVSIASPLCFYFGSARGLAGGNVRCLELSNSSFFCCCCCCTGLGAFDGACF